MPDPVKQLSYDEFEEKLSRNLQIPRGLLRGMTSVESNGNPDAVSSVGAKGRFQVMPATFEDAKRRWKMPHLDANNEFDNAYVGARYLKEQYDASAGDFPSERARWGAAVSRYHGGGTDKQGNVRAVSDGGITTDKHVEKVMKRWASVENQNPDPRWNPQAQAYDWSADTLDWKSINAANRPAPAKPAPAKTGVFGMEGRAESQGIAPPAMRLDDAPAVKPAPEGSGAFLRGFDKLRGNAFEKLASDSLANVEAESTRGQLATQQAIQRQRGTVDITKPQRSATMDRRLQENKPVVPRLTAQAIQNNVRQPDVFGIEGRSEGPRTKPPVDRLARQRQQMEARDKQPYVDAAQNGILAPYLQEFESYGWNTKPMVDNVAGALQSADRIINQPIDVQETARRAGAALQKLPGDIIQGAANLSDALGDSGLRVIDNAPRLSEPVRTRVEQANRQIDAEMGVNPDVPSSLATVATEGAISSLPYLATGAVGAGMRGVAAMGAAQNMGQTYQAMRNQGAPQDVALQRSIQAAPIGALEGLVGTEAALAKAGVSPGLIRQFGAAMRAAPADMAQEVTSQVANNLNQERPVLEGVVEAAIGSLATTGALGGASALGRSAQAVRQNANMRSANAQEAALLQEAEQYRNAARPTSQQYQTEIVPISSLRTAPTTAPTVTPATDTTQPDGAGQQTAPVSAPTGFVPRVTDTTGMGRSQRMIAEMQDRVYNEKARAQWEKQQAKTVQPKVEIVPGDAELVAGTKLTTVKVDGQEYTVRFQGVDTQTARVAAQQQIRKGQGNAPTAPSTPSPAPQGAPPPPPAAPSVRSVEPAPVPARGATIQAQDKAATIERIRTQAIRTENSIRNVRAEDPTPDTDLYWLNETDPAFVEASRKTGLLAHGMVRGGTAEKLASLDGILTEGLHRGVINSGEFGNRGNIYEGGYWDNGVSAVLLFSPDSVDVDGAYSQGTKPVAVYLSETLAPSLESFQRLYPDTQFLTKDTIKGWVAQYKPARGANIQAQVPPAVSENAPSNVVKLENERTGNPPSAPTVQGTQSPRLVADAQRGADGGAYVRAEAQAAAQGRDSSRESGAIVNEQQVQNSAASTRPDVTQGSSRGQRDTGQVRAVASVAAEPVSRESDIYRTKGGTVSEAQLAAIDARAEKRSETSVGTMGQFQRNARRSFDDGATPGLAYSPELQKMMGLPELTDPDTEIVIGGKKTKKKDIQAQHVMDALADVAGVNRSSNLTEDGFEKIGTYLAEQQASRALLTTFERARAVTGNTLKKVDALFDRDSLSVLLDEAGKVYDSKTGKIAIRGDLRKRLKAEFDALIAEYKQDESYDKITETALDNFRTDITEGRLRIPAEPKSYLTRLYRERQSRSANEAEAGRAPEAPPQPATNEPGTADRAGDAERGSEGAAAQDAQQNREHVDLPSASPFTEPPSIESLSHMLPRRSLRSLSVDERAQLAAAQSNPDIPVPAFPVKGKPSSMALVEGNEVFGGQSIVRYGAQGEPIGILHFDVDAQGRPDVAVVAVDPKYRRQGIASSLYDFAYNNGIDLSTAEGKGGYTEEGKALKRGREAKANRASDAQRREPQPEPPTVEQAGEQVADDIPRRTASRIEQAQIEAANWRKAQDIDRVPNGWRIQETEKGALLYNPETKEILTFEAESGKRYADVLEQRTRAGVYAQDNPVTITVPEGELKVEPIFTPPAQPSPPQPATPDTAPMVKPETQPTKPGDARAQALYDKAKAALEKGTGDTGNPLSPAARKAYEDDLRRFGKQLGLPTEIVQKEAETVATPVGKVVDGKVGVGDRVSAKWVEWGGEGTVKDVLPNGDLVITVESDPGRSGKFNRTGKDITVRADIARRLLAMDSPDAAEAETVTTPSAGKGEGKTASGRQKSTGKRIDAVEADIQAIRQQMQQVNQEMKTAKGARYDRLGKQYAALAGKEAALNYRRDNLVETEEKLSKSQNRQSRKQVESKLAEIATKAEETGQPVDVAVADYLQNKDLPGIEVLDAKQKSELARIAGVTDKAPLSTEQVAKLQKEEVRLMKQAAGEKNMRAHNRLMKELRDVQTALNPHRNRILATPEVQQRVAESVNKEKISDRTGLTKTQASYLQEKVKASIPMLTDGKLPEVTIPVPGDGEFRVRSEQQAKNLLKRIDAPVLKLDSSVAVGRWSPSSSKSAAVPRDIGANDVTGKSFEGSNVTGIFPLERAAKTDGWAGNRIEKGEIVSDGETAFVASALSAKDAAAFRKEGEGRKSAQDSAAKLLADVFKTNKIPLTVQGATVHRSKTQKGDRIDSQVVILTPTDGTGSPVIADAAKVRTVLDATGATEIRGAQNPEDPISFYKNGKGVAVVMPLRGGLDNVETVLKEMREAGTNTPTRPNRAQRGEQGMIDFGALFGRNGKPTQKAEAALREKLPVPESFKLEAFLDETKKLLAKANLSKRTDDKFADALEGAFTGYLNGDYAALLKHQTEMKRLLGSKWNVVADFLRPLNATGEVSVLMRQGFIGWATHPILSSRALREAGATDAKYWDFVAKFASSPVRDFAEKAGVDFGLSQDIKLGGGHFLGGEENAMVSAVQKIPVLKQMERLNKSFIDGQRMQLFEYGLQQIKKAGKPIANADGTPSIHAVRWAKEINRVTGRAVIPERAQATVDAASLGLYSPRFTISRFQALNPFRILTEARHSSTVAKEIFKDYAKLASVASALALTAAMAGFEVKLDDPEDADFLTVKKGRWKIPILQGGLHAQAKFAVRMMMRMREMKNGQAFEKEKGIDRAVQQTGKFLRYKEAPMVGLLHDQLFARQDVEDYKTGQKVNMGTNAIGNPISFPADLASKMAPITWQQLVEAYDQEGLLGTAKVAPEMFGLSSNLNTSSREPVDDKDSKVNGKEFIKQRWSYSEGNRLADRLPVGRDTFTRMGLRAGMEPQARFEARANTGRDLYEKVATPIVTSDWYKSASPEKKEWVEQRLQERVASQVNKDNVQEAKLSIRSLELAWRQRESQQKRDTKERTRRFGAQ